MISVNDYYNNKKLLNVTYIPYSKKVEIIDYIIDSSSEYIGGIYYIDLVSTRNVWETVIIQTITNLDLTTIDEDGIIGFDNLHRLNIYNELIETIKYEYDMFINILNEKVKYFNLINQSNSALLPKVFESFSNTLNGISDFLSNIDYEKLSEMQKIMENDNVITN